MDVASVTADHITEVLNRVIEFTRRRRDLLTQNIFECSRPGFVPKDLPSAEFADCMTRAVSEHILHKRLVYIDSDNISFESGGNISTRPVVDEKARRLMQKDPKQYYQYQLKKLAENTLNNRIAVQLLGIRKKQPDTIREK